VIKDWIYEKIDWLIDMGFEQVTELIAELLPQSVSKDGYVQT